MIAVEESYDRDGNMREQKSLGRKNLRAGGHRQDAYVGEHCHSIAVVLLYCSTVVTIIVKAPPFRSASFLETFVLHGN